MGSKGGGKGRNGRKDEEGGKEQVRKRGNGKWRTKKESWVTGLTGVFMTVIHRQNDEGDRM